jgi:hypothetical protein
MRFTVFICASAVCVDKNHDLYIGHAVGEGSIVHGFEHEYGFSFEYKVFF